MSDNLLNSRINEFIEAIMKVAQGDFTIQLDLTGENNHLDALAMGINMMVDDLKKGRDTALENDRIKLLNAQLVEANVKALESDRLKSMFLQNVSHEIRTPLNAIIGFSELLPRYFENKDKLNYFSTIIKQRGFDLLDLINDILDLSQIETGQLPINLENFELSELLIDLHTFFINHRQKINKTHIELHYETDPCHKQKYIHTDKGKIKQIFVNLIYNAFKFTEAGTIKFGYTIDGKNSIEYFVSDTGLGIPVDKQSVIFERFVQLENETDNTQHGTGLGLSIVKGLIELMGGSISLQTTAGKGSTFYFTVPYESTDVTGVKIVNKGIPTCIDWHQYTILVVEDDIYNAEYLEEVLSETKINVLKSSNAKDAIDIINLDLPVDIVLMDVKLPGINGLEATRILKSKMPRIRVIAQTAYSSNEDAKKAINAGCDDYICKPFNKDLLIKKINKQLGYL